MREELTGDGLIRWPQTGATKGTGRSCWLVHVESPAAWVERSVMISKFVLFQPTHKDTHYQI